MAKTGDKKLQNEIGELESRLVRALADYDNLQKRTEIEKETWVSRANLNLIKELLPLFDLVTKAQASLNDPALELVKKEFTTIFDKAGLEPIDKAEVEFDPHIHEVVDLVPGGRKGQVAEVVLPGYRTSDWVLRPAVVKVYSDDKN